MRGCVNEGDRKGKSELVLCCKRLITFRHDNGFILLPTKATRDNQITDYWTR